MELKQFDESVIGCTNTRNWNAWINTKPPKPDPMHVVGEVEVPNLGVRALLVKKTPQGINPTILSLDLFLIQQPGIWPQVTSWVTAHYEEMTSAEYERATVHCGQTLVADIPVGIAR